MSDLPVWMRGSDVQKLAAIAEKYWNQVAQQIDFWLAHLNSLDVSEPILDMLAYERGITRLPNEPLALYAKRVQTAHVNAQDAGTAAGMERIFKRLGFAQASISERLPWFEWDQIQVDMVESEFGGNERLIIEIIESYGKTCRRYIVNANSVTAKEERAGVTQFNKEVVGL